MKPKRFWRLLALVFLFFVLIRLPGFWLAMAEDEQFWAIASVAPTGFQYHLVPHPPLTVFLYSLVGLSGQWRLLHLVPLIFSVGIFALTVLFARKYFGDTAALIAGLLLTVSAWSVLASVQIDMDGSILAFLGMLAAWCFLEGVERSSWRWYLAAGVVGAIGMMAKTSFILFPAAFGAYALWLVFDAGSRWRQRFKELLPSVWAAAIPVAAITLFLLVSTGQGSLVGAHGSHYFSGFFSQDWLNVLSILAQAVVLASPLLIMLPKLQLLSSDKWKRPNLFAIIVVVHLIFYLFIVTASYRPFERYWMVMIPSLAILSSAYLASFKIKAVEWANVALAAAAGFILLVIATIIAKPSLLPLFPKDLYLSKLFSLSWNFFFPFHGASGPVGFFIPFWLVPLCFGACAILAILAWRGKRAALLAFLAVAIAMNLFVAEELLFSLTGPNVNRVADEVWGSVQGKELKEPVFAYQGTAHFLLNQSGVHAIPIFAVQYQDAALAGRISRGGTVLIVEFPSASHRSALWGALSRCKTERIVEEKGLPLGYVFTC